MPESFTLSLPAAGGYDEVAADVAGKYLELAGGTPADRQALSAALRQAIEDVAAAGAADVVCVFGGGASGVEVAVTCGHETRTVTQAVSGPRSGA